MWVTQEARALQDLPSACGLLPRRPAVSAGACLRRSPRCWARRNVEGYAFTSCTARPSELSCRKRAQRSGRLTTRSNGIRVASAILAVESHAVAARVLEMGQGT